MLAGESACSALKHDLGAEEPEGKDPGPDDTAVGVPESMPVPHVSVSGLGDELVCDSKKNCRGRTK